MQRMISVDKLARPADHILLPAERMRHARARPGPHADQPDAV